jgi:hypothetical protein
LLTGDENISRSVRQLIRFGFFESAVIAAKRITDSRLRSRLFVQVGREYVLIYSSYYRRGGKNKVVGERALSNALIISEIVPDIEERVIFNLSIINAVILNKRYDKETAEMLERLFELTSQDIENIEKPKTNDAKKSETGENANENNGENASEKNDNGDSVVESSNLTRRLRGEIFSMFLLARVNFDELRFDSENKNKDRIVDNNRNDKVSELWSVELSELSDRVIRELTSERSTLSKSRGLLNVSTLYLRLGKLSEAAQTAKLAENAAAELVEKSDSIFILSELLLVYGSLNDMESYLRVRNRAIDLGVSFIQAGVELSQVNVLWRTRDIELDRVMRKLIELDKFDDVVSLVDNIHEPIIYDRVLRIIIYIYIEKHEFEHAELLAKALRLSEYRFSALRDVRLVKNLTNSNNAEKTSEESTKKIENKTENK